MSVFTLNTDLIVREYLPPDKREDKEISWLNALLAPLQTLHDDTYLVYRPDVTGRAKRTGQRIVLESVLNDVFNVVGPQFIYIDNSGNNVTSDIFFNQSEGLPASFFFNQSEGQPAFFLKNESELTNNKEFKVYVPTAIYLANGEDTIRSEVDILRPYSTIYTIIQY